MKAEIIGPWTGTGTEEDSNRPKVADDYQIDKWTDVTGQPSENLQPDPNLYAIEIECSQAVLDAINADSNYLVMWSEE